MENRWVYKQDGESQVVKHLSEELSIDASLANLLAQRGVSTFEEARYFSSVAYTPARSVSDERYGQSG